MIATQDTTQNKMNTTIQSPTYDIIINKPNALQSLIEEINPSKVFVIVDQNSEQYCLHMILEELPINSVIIQIEAGELNKNIATTAFVWKSLLDNGADRQSLVVNLGGGVIGDLGGFCAGTFMRGIKFIQIPTTLLSQVDSSVGGKLGIDFENVKNIIGVFQFPEAVVIDTIFLKTLPYKQLLNGYAEVLKHALIADKDLWYELVDQMDILALPMDMLIARNVTIKNDVVIADPKEKGLRKILNFGHTIGHAIESLLLGTDEELLHGESIAIGMVCEAYLAHVKSFISYEECLSIKKTFIKLYGHKYKSLPRVEDIIKTMKHDKKNKNGIIMFSLLESIGKGNYDIQVSSEEIEQSLDWYDNKI
jgi:3-dehydroquinate synthase